MQSRKSSSKGGFSGALCRNDLTRFWPLWAVYLAGWLIAMPVVQAAQLFTQNSWSGEDLRTNAKETVLIMSGSAATAVALVAGCLLAMALFSYLMNARSVGFAHALPVRREGLFLTHYLTGLGVGAAANTVAALLTMAVWAAAGITDFWVIGVWFLSLTGQELFFYSLGVLCCMLTGQILAVPVFYAVVNALAATVTALLQSLAGFFFYGWSHADYPAAVEWLTPVAQLSDKVGYSATYDQAGNLLTTLEFHGLSTVGIYALAGIVLAGLALALYLRRPSESAGDVVSVGWMKPVFRYGVGFCAGISLGQLLYALVWEFAGGEPFLPVLTVCMILTGVVGYYAAEMLLQKSFRVFNKRSWIHAAVVSAAILLLCGGMGADVLGVETKVPAADAVEKMDAGFSGYGNDLNLYNIADPALIGKVAAAQQVLVDQRPGRMTGARADGKEIGYAYFYVRYTLQTGKTLYRTYDFDYTMAELDDPASPVSALAAIVRDPAAQRARLEEDLGNLDRLLGGELQTFRGVTQDDVGYIETNWGAADFDAKTAQTLLDAFYKDVDAGHAGVDAFSSTWEETAYSNNLTLYFKPKPAEGATPREYAHAENGVSLSFSRHYTYLLDALEAEGLSGGLITHAEVDVFQRGKTAADVGITMETADAVLAAKRTDTSVGGPAPEIAPGGGPILGGADGPTAIVVS